ncbi:hypothetical protein [Butyrivibrio sp. NC3005]|uniref:hypothetical protein n=1 Tax=Butyrivibrio sp. NC3005 TaxID=1280685 RepID=UPI000408112A|nr:hypothetical protein [Butyrivibrio sp. NC3005]
MKVSVAKKLLVTSLVATMVLAPCTAFAKTHTATPEAPKYYPTAEEPEPAPKNYEPTSEVAGAKSQLPGAYAVKKLAGFAVTTSLANAIANLGLTGAERPFIKVYDISAKNSPLAFACIDAAAKSVGGTVIEAINVDFGKMSGGKFVRLENGEVVAKVGLKKNQVVAGKKYAIVQVLPGGATKIIEDQDNDPNTVTFPVQAGLGAYAVIVY